MYFSDEETQKDRYLTFQVCKEIYGIGITYVTEIVRLQPITVMPETPCHIKGIINLRGIIIPVVDMRIRLGKDPIPYSDRTCIVIIQINNTLAGLIVDRVDEVQRIPDERILPPDNMTTGYNCRFVKGVGDTDSGMALLLDCEMILNGEVETNKTVLGEE